MENDQNKKKGKLAPLRIFILIFALGFLIIGIFQTVQQGFSYSYWLFIYSAILFIIFNFVKNRKKSDSDGE